MLRQWTAEQTHFPPYSADYGTVRREDTHRSLSGVTRISAEGHRHGIRGFKTDAGRSQANSEHFRDVKCFVSRFLGFQEPETLGKGEPFVPFMIHKTNERLKFLSGPSTLTIPLPFGFGRVGINALPALSKDQPRGRPWKSPSVVARASVPCV